MRSLDEMARTPDSPIRRQAANKDDTRSWLRQAMSQLQDAERYEAPGARGKPAAASINPDTCVLCAYHAILSAALAALCAEGYRITSGQGHHSVALEGFAHLVGLSQSEYDRVETVRDMRSTFYTGRLMPGPAEAAGSIATARMALDAAERWLQEVHPEVLRA